MFGFFYVLFCIVVSIVVSFWVVEVYFVFSDVYFVVVVCNEVGFGLVLSNVECIFGGEVN